MMGPSRFLAVLSVSSLLFLSFSHGFGRVLTETVQHEHSTATAETEEISGKSRVMIEMMDYGDPGANTNPKYGGLFSPPPPTVSPPPPTVSPPPPTVSPPPS